MEQWPGELIWLGTCISVDNEVNNSLLLLNQVRLSFGLSNQAGWDLVSNSNSLKTIDFIRV